jgi:hypothetical protein
MSALAATLALIDAAPEQAVPEQAAQLLAAGEQVLATWLVAHGETPTTQLREGFRLLALQRQGARRDPSFNACRETCRELVYHYNAIQVATPTAGATLLVMMRFVARHLALFVDGKLAAQGVGEFCCASRPLRESDTVAEQN